MLDEMERALHDSLCVIKRTLESGKVVPGGGAVEAALSIYLENFATTLVRTFPRKFRVIAIQSFVDRHTLRNTHLAFRNCWR